MSYQYLLIFKGNFKINAVLDLDAGDFLTFCRL